MERCNEDLAKTTEFYLETGEEIYANKTTTHLKRRKLVDTIIDLLVEDKYDMNVIATSIKYMDQLYCVVTKENAADIPKLGNSAIWLAIKMHSITMDDAPIFANKITGATPEALKDYEIRLITSNMIKLYVNIVPFYFESDLPLYRQYKEVASFCDVRWNTIFYYA